MKVQLTIPDNKSGWLLALLRDIPEVQVQVI